MQYKCARETILEMVVGPPEPVFRNRLQTALLQVYLCYAQR